ncbi:TPA: response regulator [Legionella pneumophila]|nr:response regulator [Legionella pneumophila]HAT8333233.1 response regulator [Legionella pneumophila]
MKKIKRDETEDQLPQQLSARDNTLEQQKNIINQLEQENYQLKNLIDNLPGDIYWKDIHGIWSGVNKRGAQSLQKIGFICDRNDVIGKSDYELFSKETADEYRKNDLEVMNKKVEIIREEINQLPNGEKIIQLSTKRPLWDKEGRVVGVVGNTIDISYLKKIESDLKKAIEQSEAANKAKTEFLENMRHDIRTPLTGIIGFSELLKMLADNDLIKEYAENLMASSHALLDLLDEVLESIRVSSGDIPKLKKKFSLKHTLKQIIDLNLARAGQKKLLLQLDMDSSIPDYVIGDKVRIHRVVLELVANALNFTETGYVRLSASIFKSPQGKTVLKLIVEDSGIGIPKEKQQEIYIQFKRLTPSYEGIYKGAGLGLSVVKQFIEELNGEIYVSSELQKGTTFTCLIPLQEPLSNDTLGVEDEGEPITETKPEKPNITSSQTSQKAQPFNVLVVEDNLIAQTVAKAILNQLNCHVTLAETGKKALEAWKKDKFDLIFMDIGLPDWDGYEVTHQIRLQELVQKTHIPIIALTAHAGDENKQRCIQAGMNAVLIKPLSLASCSNALQSFIPNFNQSKTQEQIIASHELPTEEKALFNLEQFPLLDCDEGIKTTSSETALAEMLSFMIESLPEDIELMKQFYAQGDWEKTQNIAHKIKGGAVYVGTIRMKMACQYLERYWKSGQRKLLEPLYQQVIKTLDESVLEITQWLKTH